MVLRNTLAVMEKQQHLIHLMLQEVKVVSQVQVVAREVPVVALVPIRKTVLEWPQQEVQMEQMVALLHILVELDKEQQLENSLKVVVFYMLAAAAVVLKLMVRLEKVELAAAVKVAKAMLMENQLRQIQEVAAVASSQISSAPQLGQR